MSFSVFMSRREAIVEAVAIGIGHDVDTPTFEDLPSYLPNGWESVETSIPLIDVIDAAGDHAIFRKPCFATSDGERFNSSDERFGTADGWSTAETSVEEFAEAVADDDFAEPFPGDETAEPLVIPVEPEAEPEKPIQRATFSASRKELTEAIREISAAVPRRTSKLAYQAIRLGVNGTIEFRATDGEQSAKIERDFYRSGEAEILIDPKRISAALKTIKYHSVDVEIIGEELTIGASTIPATEPIEDFPTAGWDIEAGDDRAEFWIDGQAFAAAVSRTEFCVDPNSARYAMGGILLEADESEARLVSTDGRRLAIVEMGRPEKFRSDEFDHRVSYLVPPATMLRVAKAVGKSPRDVRVIAHESVPVWNDTPVPGIGADGKWTAEKHVPAEPGKTLQVTFIVETAVGSQRFTTKLIEGKFPEFRQVIPANQPICHRFLASELLEAVKLAMSVDTPESRGADFHFTEDRLEITHKSTAGKIRTTVHGATMQGAGTAVLATFDSRYLADFLETIPPASLIDWRMTDHESAAMIEFTDNSLFSYVIMPLTRDA